MDKLPFTRFKDLKHEQIKQGQWVSIDDNHTTVQRLGVITDVDTTKTQYPDPLFKVVHYDGLTAPTNDVEVLKNFHSVPMLFYYMTGAELAEVMAAQVEGLLTEQPPLQLEVVQPPPYEPEPLQLTSLPNPYTDWLDKVPDLSGMTQWEDLPVDRITQLMTGQTSTGPFENKMDAQHIVSVPQAKSNLKQVVVADAEGVIVIPMILLPEGYVQVDQYPVYTPDGNHPPIDHEAYQKRKETILQQIRDTMQGRTADEPLILYNDTPFNPFPVLVSDINQPEEPIHIVVRVNVDGSYHYTNATEDMKGSIDEVLAGVALFIEPKDAKETEQDRTTGPETDTENV